jgi:AbrB family transcriptional regulator, stage V sporulation protein T
VTYQAKVIAGGKIVIPADVRRQLGIADGDRVNIEVADGKMTLKTRDQAIKEIQSRYAHLKRPGVSEVDEFIAERRAEAVREDEEFEKYHARRLRGDI